MLLRTSILVSLAAAMPVAVCGQESVRLEEKCPTGSQYAVTSRSDLTGSVTLPVPMAKAGESKTLSVSGSSSVDYAERILAHDSSGAVQKTLRQYDRLDYRRKIGDQNQESTLRAQARRMVLLRQGHKEIPFSPDGPLTWAEIDRVRTDVFTPALLGLLPTQSVAVGGTWNARSQAVQELTDLDQITAGGLVCKLVELLSRNGRQYAHVAVSGTVTGTNEDGPNRQQIDGYFYFDLQSNHLSYLFLNGTSWLLDMDGKPLGKLEGRFVLTRRLEGSHHLSDEQLRTLVLEPNQENTQLLFHEPVFGVRFVYPRRWTVRQADARQIILDEPSGGGLVITLEPLAQTPTGQQFQAEALGVLQKRQGRILKSQPLRRLETDIPLLDHFAMEVECEKQIDFLDFYVSRQVSGGATFAGRYPLKEAAALQREVERMARGLRLVPPVR